MPSISFVTCSLMEGLRASTRWVVKPGSNLDLQCRALHKIPVKRAHSVDHARQLLKCFRPYEDGLVRWAVNSGLTMDLQCSALKKCTLKNCVYQLSGPAAHLKRVAIVYITFVYFCLAGETSTKQGT
jgi:hypothetical protein